MNDNGEIMNDKWRFADAGDPGFRFILHAPGRSQEKDTEEGTNGSPPGGLARRAGQGHLAVIVGQAGTGKSLLAMQITSALRNAARKVHDHVDEKNPPENYTNDHAVFYFTLEASPNELIDQASRFNHVWDSEFLLTEEDRKQANPRIEQWKTYFYHVPVPAGSVQSLVRRIDLFISEKVKDFKKLLALVIDPLGGLQLEADIRPGMELLRQVALSYKTFLFVVVEDYVYKQLPQIEHYAHSVIRLTYEPSMSPARSLVIQKARGQYFYPGRHEFRIRSKKKSEKGWGGLRVFPSLFAQSDSAHRELKRQDLKPPEEEPPKQPFFPNDDKLKGLPKIRPGTAAFLMGPPGTFKHQIAAGFARSLREETPPLFITFKADPSAVKKAFNVACYENDDREEKVNIVDARNPGRTPEDVIAEVRRLLEPEDSHPEETKNAPPKRAVVWGIRRLRDFPNFGEAKTVQFLEALVTLLRSKSCTTLLVDWPDIQRASILPVVDICESILLTRIARRSWQAQFHSQQPLNEEEEALFEKIFEEIWQMPPDKNATDKDATDEHTPDEEKHDHAALLRFRRSSGGLHRNIGVALPRSETSLQKKPIEWVRIDKAIFERAWSVVGIQWEEDPSLVEEWTRSAFTSTRNQT